MKITIPYRLASREKRVPSWKVGMIGLLVLLLWEALVDLDIISSLYIPSPWSILHALFLMAVEGELWRNTIASLYRIALGYIFGAVPALVLGLLFGTCRYMEALGKPVVHALYPIPKIALLPLIILWLGIGEVSKITIIALGVFFPVIINTYHGVKNIPSIYIRVGLTYGLTTYQLLRTIIFPAALPAIFSGLKLAAGSSLLLLVAAEMIAAKEGLGALILHYGDLMITNKLMAGVVLLSLLGLLFNKLLEWWEKRMIKW